MPKKYWYKVGMKSRNGSIRSISDNIPKELQLRYKDTFVTEAIEGTMGIFLFRNREDARKFRKTFGQEVSKIKKVIPLDDPWPVYYAISDWLLKNKIRTQLFLTNKSLIDCYKYALKNTPTNTLFPQGTYVCKAVKVIGDAW